MQSLCSRRVSSVRSVPVVVLALGMLGLSIVGAGCPADDAPATDAPTACIDGAVDCPCDNDDRCETTESGSSLLCVSGTCRDCAAGVEDCACKTGARCGPDLVCSADNICVQSSCEAGQADCACDAAGKCNDPALHCAVDRVCRGLTTDCSPGDVDCECVGGSCDPGLTCLEGRVCIDATGYLGGPCLEGDGCYAGNRCERDLCVACKPGSQACACSADQVCDLGLNCVGGECIATTGLALGTPTNADCHTPCQEDFSVSGDFRPCVDGLVAGCVGDLICQHGQCVATQDDRRTCTLNVECPAHQTCLSGFCTPNCQGDSECVDTAVCHQKVCRLACEVEGATCPSGHNCQLVDGQTGVCVQQDAGSQVLPPTAPSGLSLSATALTMSSAQPEGTITITNTATATATLVIQRRVHRYYDDTNTLQPVALGAASHAVATVAERATCVPGTVGCGCAGPSQNLCSTFENGIEMKCVEAAGGNVCRPPTCSDASEQGCVCEGDTCLRYCETSNCPLWWVELVVEKDGQAGAPSTNIHTSLTLEPNESATLRISAADASSYSWWEGELAIVNQADQTSTPIQVGYSQRPDGAWSGEIFYFGDFRLSRNGLDAWIDGGRKGPDIAGIQNAFLQAWATFRLGNIDFETFSAILTATRTESWRSPAMAQFCPDAVCYPFNNPLGYQTYTNDPDSEPVPSAAIELPFAMNIKQVDGASYQGKVDSNRSLHYPGEPQVVLQFAGAPDSCSRQSEAGCLLFLDELGFTSVIGGRSEAASCDPRFEAASEPWLIPGFLGNAQLDEQNGMYLTQSCRDQEAPLETGASANVAFNRSLSRANPVPDGEVRRRRVELIDGALINTDTMFVLFRERMDSWTPGDEDIVAYGYMLLTREDRELGPEDTSGNLPAAATGNTAPALACDSALLSEVGFSSANTDPAGLARVLLDGVAQEQLGGPLEEGSDERPHYLCVETGQFNGGSAGPNDLNPCPAGSDVIYFTLSETLIPSDTLTNHPCQVDQTCGQVLDNYRSQNLLLQDPVYWRCEDDQLAYCSTDRHDLRNGKVFYFVQQGPKVLQRIKPAVDDAFRYRTRFQNRAGTNLGFVPEICIEGSDAIPYCYDAKAIEQLEARVDCLLATFVAHGQSIKSTDIQAYTDLKAYLVDNFAYDAAFDPTLNITVHNSGFERLNAELSVMLGDDAFTKALSSRFDLAGLSVAAFPGELFEPNGINLTGVAGAEMFQMYLAVQYYRRTLDRFFKLLPALEQSLEQGVDGQLIDAASVDAWFGRLIRASTQKARVWSEISRRYQNFNRPDLARLVIQRGYVASYLESIVLTHLMQNIVDNVAAQDRAQITRAIRTAQLSYRVAMSDMRTQYDAITEDVDYFGFPPDFMPFPAAEASVARDNGFEVAANRALQRLQIAAGAEEQAISATRTFDVEAASFQNELTRIENNYESQLVDLCGSFEADGKIFPAIRKYAYLDETTQALGDPCGLMRNGRIHDTLGDVDQAALRIQQVRQQMANVLSEAAIEEERIDATCATKDSWKSAIVSLNNQQTSLQKEIDKTQNVMSELDRKYRAAQTFAELTKCALIVGTSAGGDCATSVTARIGFGIATAAIEVTNTRLNIDIIEKQDEVRQIQLQEQLITYDFCQADGSALVQIDSRARVKTMLLRIKELELEALQADYGLQQVFARLQQARNTARRTEAELEEMTQLTINVEAARNNPNVRIYRSDAVINADLTFYSALREAYKATLVLEYYTSQSYADKDKLFLVRMINRGDYNLQNYMIALEDEFRLFEDIVGVPDLRLLRVSMRDDILQIPFSKPTGEPYSQTERFELFRKRLTEGTLLNEDGYIAAPFSIDVKDLSPLTRNHKVRNVEAELVGSGLGDPLARVYLRMAGTSAIRPLDGEMQYLTFPARTGVINAFINAAKPFNPQVYPTSRFAERPLLNSRWEVVVNRLDEPENEDLALEGLTDVLLYFYYSDFTQL